MPNESISEIMDKLLQRRSEIMKEAAALDGLISVYQGLLQRQDSESDEALGQLNLYHPPASRAVRAAEMTKMIEVARRIIISEGRPMKRGELVQRLEKQGFTLPGRDKNKVFGTNVWRSGKFRTIEEQGYWPKDVTLPKK